MKWPSGQLMVFFPGSLVCRELEIGGSTVSWSPARAARAGGPRRFEGGGTPSVLYPHASASRLGRRPRAAAAASGARGGLGGGRLAVAPPLSAFRVGPVCLPTVDGTQVAMAMHTISRLGHACTAVRFCTLVRAK